MLRRITSFVAFCLLVGPVQADDDQYFDSDGVKIHYIIEGKGEPVILVHGFTSSIQQEWQRTGVIPTLSKKFQIIALDARGHGKSDKPTDSEKYGSEMASDVLRLMDHLKLKKAHIVGYSLGGLTTLYLVANHPDRFISATIGGMGWLKADDKRMALTGNLAQLFDNGKEISELISRFRPAGTPLTGGGLAGQLRALSSSNAKSLGACARAIPELAVTEDQLKANKLPTFAIVGDKDLLKVTVDDLQKVMPNLTVVLVEGGEHESTLRAPKFTDEVTAFIEEHSAVVDGPAK